MGASGRDKRERGAGRESTGVVACYFYWGDPRQRGECVRVGGEGGSGSGSRRRQPRLRRRGHAAAPRGAGAAICQRANGAELAVAWASSGARRAGDVGRSVALSLVRPSPRLHGTATAQHTAPPCFLSLPGTHRHRSTRPGAKACPARVRRPPAPSQDHTQPNPQAPASGMWAAAFPLRLHHATRPGGRLARSRCVRLLPSPAPSRGKAHASSGRACEQFGYG